MLQFNLKQNNSPFRPVIILMIGPVGAPRRRDALCTARGARVRSGGAVVKRIAPSWRVKVLLQHAVATDIAAAFSVAGGFIFPIKRSLTTITLGLQV